MATDRYWEILAAIQNESKHLMCFHDDLECGKLLGWDWYCRVAEAGIKDCKERISKLKDLLEEEKKYLSDFSL